MSSCRVDVSAVIAATLIALPALAADLLVPQQYATIQDAVNAASGGDRVLVSPGTYHEQVNLSGKGLQLIGVEGAAATAIDGDNARTVIVGNGEPDTCLVQGFTIQHGRDYGYHNGGGVRIYNSSVTVDSCRLVSNRAEDPGWWGGGAWLSEYGSPKITNCIFVGNYGAGNAAGVYHYLGGGISLSDCVFQDNISNSGQCIHIQTEGGTIVASIERCTFRRNQSRTDLSYKPGCFPVGFFNPYGGTISCPITNCVAEEPVFASGTDPSTIAFMVIGSHAQSRYNIALSNIRCCGLPNLVCSDGNSAWQDDGGNTLATQCCPSDLDGDAQVNTADISLALMDFGDCLGCKSDLDGSGFTDSADMSLLLLDFGSCAAN
jgi:hypothetical protein